jgi:hypothetical protein
MNKIENTNSKNTRTSLLSKSNEGFGSSALMSFIKNYCSKVALALALGVATTSISEAQNNVCLPSFTLDVPAAYNFNVLGPVFNGWTTLAAADMDADGDIDLIIGDDGGNLRYVQNTGSANAPFYAASVTIAPSPGFETHPTIADLDGDGDFDVLCGTWSGGRFEYYQNIGSATNPVFAARVVNPFGLTALTFQCTPEFVDIDGDGDFDVIAGNGTFGVAENVSYFQNIGTPTAPNFAARVADPFGFANIPSNNDLIKLDKVDIDGDGDIDFVYGNTDSGEMGFLINVGNTTAPNFVDLGSNLGLDDGISSDHTPIVLDIDSDGQFEAIVGSTQGDPVTYQGSKLTPQLSIAEGTSVSTCEPVTLNATSNNSLVADLTITWFDAAGRVVGTGPTFTTGDPYTDGALLYRASAVNASGCVSNPTNFVNVSCNAQVIITLAVTAGYNEAQLSWETVGSRPVVGYEVYVSFDGGTPNILYGTTTYKTYLADALLNGVNTSFAVVAIYRGGARSLASNTVTVRPSVILGEDDASEKGFAFFPNPNNGEFNLKLQDGSTSAKVSVVSLSGQRVYTSTLNATQTSINLTNVASGMYIVRVETEQGIYQQKVSVVR